MRYDSVLKMLIEQGIDINQNNTIMCDAIYCNPQIIPTLIEAGVPVEHKHINSLLNRMTYDRPHCEYTERLTKEVFRQTFKVLINHVTDIAELLKYKHNNTARHIGDKLIKHGLIDADIAAELYSFGQLV